MANIITETASDQLMLNAPVREADGITRHLVRPNKVSGTMYKRLTSVSYENSVPPQPPDNPSPYIVDPEGNRVDIGHVLLTIDALTHTTTGEPYKGFGIPSIDPASCVVDIGIAAVWAEHDGPHAPRILPKLASGEPDLPGYFAMSAPVSDLLGDIDGFNILNLWIGIGGPLSEVLTLYYLGGANQEAAYHRRFRTFADNNFGAVSTSGTEPYAEALRPFWLKRINRFCDLYFDDGKSFFSLSYPPPATWRYALQVLERFLSWLFTGYTIEQSKHP
ncbi:hypothetical protein [Robertmurraya sp. P23]|uniref:hypothetical protein n=1 Tax=Robertmurraya sp. P23 TaxID=3436931 RepID=UPI003D953177